MDKHNSEKMLKLDFKIFINEKIFQILLGILLISLCFASGTNKYLVGQSERGLKKGKN